MDLSPRQIVTELNKHIIGQDEAKKAVAIALRNRYRRSQLSKELREEITPKNIIMKGPTGVGKTEIARRLAKLVKAPFIKVEATKYTEVGYVGKDVEGMVRDLVECAVRLVKDEKTAEVSVKATDAAEKKMVKILAEVKKNDRGETARCSNKISSIPCARGRSISSSSRRKSRMSPRTWNLSRAGRRSTSALSSARCCPPRKRSASSPCPKR